MALSASTGAERVEVLLELPHELTVADGHNPQIVHLADRQQRDLSYGLACDRWGAFRVGRVFLSDHDVFGLFRHESVVDARQPLKVYPTEQAVRNLLRPLETQVFTGHHVARQNGEGIEFADLREFVPGDRIRHVNWRASARRGELWVNEYHAERNADVVIFLDSFAEARRGGRSTLDPALRAAASLAARYLRQKDRVGFVTFGGMLNWLLPATGTAQLYRIVDAMLDTQIILNYAWKEIDVIPKRTLPPQALVLALTPLLDDRSSNALLDLRGRGFDLVVIEISPAAFVEPPEGDVELLAERLWRLRREAVRGRFERAGVPIAVWGDDLSLAAALGGGELIPTQRAPWPAPDHGVLVAPAARGGSRVLRDCGRSAAGGRRRPRRGRSRVAVLALIGRWPSLCPRESWASARATPSSSSLPGSTVDSWAPGRRRGNLRRGRARVLVVERDDAWSEPAVLDASGLLRRPRCVAAALIGTFLLVAVSGSRAASARGPRRRAPPSSPSRLWPR